MGSEQVGMLKRVDSSVSGGRDPLHMPMWLAGTGGGARVIKQDALLTQLLHQALCRLKILQRQWRHLGFKSAANQQQVGLQHRKLVENADMLRIDIGDM